MLYLDNAATTKPDRLVMEIVNDILNENFGNPSSLHMMGVLAEKSMTIARNQIANSLKTKPENIFFTQSGTLSDNMAILGACESYKRRGKRIITTSVEHSAVRECFNHLGKSGYDVIFADGVGDSDSLLESILQSVDDNTIFVSVMHVNNEIGVIYDVERIASEIKKRFPKIIFHTDAIQAYMKIPINLGKSAIDLLSISGHKVHAPKGVGALYVKNGVRLSPIIFGGNQEKGLVSGTENVAFIAAFGAVVEKSLSNMLRYYDSVKNVRDYLLERLNAIDGAKIISPSDASAYIVSASFDKIRSEIMLHFLESMDIFVSSGSACSKGKTSPILKAYGVSQTDADCIIRISLDYTTTKTDIDRLCDALIKGTNTIIKV